MARFDVHQYRDGDLLLVNCQNEYLDHLTTRFVLPLLPPSAQAPAASRLNPMLSFRGDSYVLGTNAAATMRIADLGPVEGSVSADRDVISTAIDMLTTGF